MARSDTNLIFPTDAIPALRNARSKQWQALIDDLANLPDGAVERTAFVLLIARISNCAKCHPGSHRAMLGCVICTSQTFGRRKDSENSLLLLYEQTLREVKEHLRDPQE